MCNSVDISSFINRAALFKQQQKNTDHPHKKRKYLIWSGLNRLVKPTNLGNARFGNFPTDGGFARGIKTREKLIQFILFYHHSYLLFWRAASTSTRTSIRQNEGDFLKIFILFSCQYSYNMNNICFVVSVCVDFRIFACGCLCSSRPPTTGWSNGWNCRRRNWSKLFWR